MNLSGEDVRSLTNGRFLLTTFMVHSENIPIPLTDQWKLERVYANEENGRIYTFTAEE